MHAATNQTRGERVSMICCSRGAATNRTTNSMRSARQGGLTVTIIMMEDSRLAWLLYQHMQGKLRSIQKLQIPCFHIYYESIEVNNKNDNGNLQTHSYPYDTMVPLKVQVALPLTIFLACIGQSHCFAAAKSESLVAMQRRALAKTSANNASAKPRNRQLQQQQSQLSQHLSKSFLLEILEEAMFRQQMAIEALDREVEGKKKLEEMDNELPNHETDSDDNGNELQPVSSEEVRDNLSRVEARKNELHDVNSSLHNLRLAVERTNGQIAQKKLEQMQQQIAVLGYGSIFRQPQSTWKSTKAREQEFGRPQGFDGDIFYSPLGVPILVGRMRAHKDDIMRNAAQGSDLWFQVEDYNGSRVLLRTSLMRGTTGSKQCRQMAADVAAKYSVWGEEHYSIPVMYTDSRKVAKRGSKVGSMKKNKSLGRIMGYPQNV